MSSKMLHYGTISAHIITSKCYNKTCLSFLLACLGFFFLNFALQHLFKKVLSFFLTLQVKKGRLENLVYGIFKKKKRKTKTKKNKKKITNYKACPGCRQLRKSEQKMYKSYTVNQPDLL